MRKVIDIEVSGVDMQDYPQFCDAYFESATWEDTLEPLTEAELETFQNENGDLLNEMAHESTH